LDSSLRKPAQALRNKFAIRRTKAMKSQHSFSATLNRRLADIALLFAAVAGGPSMARAGAIVIGQIDPPGLTAGGITGITFDGGSDPLVIDGFGITMWSLSIQNASVIATFPISTTEVATRSLEFDAAMGQYFTSTRPFAADDYLSEVNPLSGTLTDIGLMGSFNFLDLAVDPVTGVLWMVNDCSNLACTSVQGGSLWTVNTANGAAQPALTFGTSLGQLTALAISPQGQFFVASAPATTTSSPSIYEIDPITGTTTFVTNTGLAPLSIITDMAFDPSTNLLYAVQELNSTGPRTFYLDEITGLPSPVPEPGTAISLVIGLGLLAAITLKRRRRHVKGCQDAAALRMAATYPRHENEEFAN
jgi:PEP-CTERM motif